MIKDTLQIDSFGFNDDHIVQYNKVGLHVDVVEPWEQMVAAAKKAGFDLALASGFRSFERQQHIWNAKMRGERPVLNDSGCAIDIAPLSPLGKIKRVMRWSALPGTSRHHWGTDIDIYDKSAIAEGYNLQLVVEEYTNNGPFAPMIEWLKAYLVQKDSPTFILPYTKDKQGVMPEPWHLSYLPVAQRYQEQWSLSQLQNHLHEADVLEKEAILSSIDILYKQYIKDSINP